MKKMVKSWFLIPPIKNHDFTIFFISDDFQAESFIEPTFIPYKYQFYELKLKIYKLYVRELSRIVDNP